MAVEITGISFPFRIGGRGGVVMSGRNIAGEQQHLKENILSIVGTKELERVMNPNMGVENLDIFLNDLNESTSTMAKYKIIQKLNQLETRITVLDLMINELSIDDESGDKFKTKQAFTIDVKFRENATGLINSSSFTI